MRRGALEALPGPGAVSKPEVPTSGKRTGSKVFGAMEYCSGRLFAQGIEGRFTSDSDQAFVQTILAQTQEHVDRLATAA